MRLFLFFATFLAPTITFAQETIDEKTLIASFETINNTYTLIGASFILGAITMVVLLIILDAIKERRAKK